jgi:hypothetical protein
MEIMEMGTSPRKDRCVFAMEIGWGCQCFPRWLGVLGINFTLMKADDQGFSQIGIRSAARHSLQHCSEWG